MKKIIINMVLFLFIFLGASLLPLKDTEAFIATLFTVSGILFSVALSIITSVNLLSVKNIYLYRDFSKSLKEKRNAIIRWFFVVLISFVLSFIETDFQYVFYFFTLSLENITIALCLLFSCKIALQFKNIQDYKSDLDDKIQEDINKEEQ